MLGHDYAKGWIELVVGPMFSGKSEELIRRVTRALIAKQVVDVFKPAIDNRFSEAAVASHAGREILAIPVHDVAEMEGLASPNGRVIAIDEAQFFDDSLVAAVERWASAGRRVILAGLDLDFRGEPFGPMPEMLARAEVVDKLTAICACGHNATRTQRLIHGSPAHYDDPIVLVGASESYEPRCRDCHTVFHGSRSVPLFSRESLEDS